MSIRPQFYTIVGALVNPKDREDIAGYDELEDGDVLVYYNDGNSSDRRWNELGVTGYEFSTLDEILYNPFGDMDYKVEGLVGMILKNHDYDDDVIRALATVDKKFEEKGFFFIPGIKKTERKFLRDKITEEDLRCNRVVPSVFESMIGVSRLHWKRAQFYLSQVGWNIKEEQLHYALVWDWS